MNQTPADLSPETAAWMQAQMAINNARTAAVLREEINKVDDWANGIFAALRDVLAYQLRESPELGKALTMIGRSVGLMAHIIEEQQNPIAQKVWDMAAGND